MYKKISVILVLFTACSLFQQEEQAVVSVADTDKGKAAIASGVQLTDEREEISDEDAPLVLVQSGQYLQAQIQEAADICFDELGIDPPQQGGG